MRHTAQQLHRLNHGHIPRTCMEALTLAVTISNYKYLVTLNGDNSKNDLHLLRGEERLLNCTKWFSALNDIGNIIVNGNNNRGSDSGGGDYRQCGGFESMNEGSSPIALIFKSLNDKKVLLP